MNNQDIHIGIVGAGRMGSAIYELLVSSSLYVVGMAETVKVLLLTKSLNLHLRYIIIMFN